MINLKFKRNTDSTKIELDGIDSSGYTGYDNSISSRGIVTRVGGKLLHVQGDFETDGTLVDISGVDLVDGTALTSTTFGSTDSTSGIWKFKNPTGVTWGTNGFHLKFE